MAILHIEGASIEVSDGARIMDGCDELGVPFGCRAGQCATCVVTVLSGMENLEPPNTREMDMGLADDQRLACQAVIGSGEVTLTY